MTVLLSPFLKFIGMTGLAGIYNIDIILILSVAVAMTLGMVLWFIKVPTTEYSRKLVRSKNVIMTAMCITSVLFFLAFYNAELDNFEKFASLVIVAITDMTSIFMSYALITLMDEKYYDQDKFYLNALMSAIMSYLLIKSFFWENPSLKMFVLVFYILFFIIHCSYHIVVFHKVYQLSLDRLENYTDEDEHRKIRWIRFCYIIMMFTQMFVLVYLLLPSSMIIVYATFYSLYMIYFVSNFISFIGSHKLLLDAFAYKTLTFQNVGRPYKPKVEATDPLYNEAAFAKIEKYIGRWIEDKKYRDCDKNREQVAKEMHTTKDMLQLYFSVRKNMDFRTWRTELRVEDAKSILLENKDLSIQAVGEMCGFSDRSNFHRQFTRMVGCSPKIWRETNGKPVRKA